MKRLACCCTALALVFAACDDRGPDRSSDPLAPTAAFAPGGSPGVNLDQWANEPGSAGWQNGNLNGNNSEYAELRVVPFRLAIEGLSTSGPHTIHINHDFTAGGRKAYDYLASYDATETGVDLCGSGGGGVSSLCGNPALESNLPAMHAVTFPRDPFIGFSGSGGDRLVGGGDTGPNSGLTDSPGGIPTAVALNGLPDVDRQLRIFGGTITGISVPVHEGSLTGNSTADMIVTFVSDGSAVLLTWGGHLACSWCWDYLVGGDFNGASQINGAPWHMRTQNLDDGGSSNQDRSIQPSAILPPAHIDGYKYEDLNRNGTHDSGEPFLEAWEIELWLNGSYFATEYTDANGYFQFPVLPPDQPFEVKEICPASGPAWTQTEPTPTNGCGSGVHTGTTVSDVTYTAWFGNYQTVDKSGMKFHDLNADGVKDTGETGLGGWTIYVDYNDNGVLDTGEPSAVTAGDGTYTITGINIGTFKVREVGQTGWFCSKPATNDAFGCYYLEDFSGAGPFVDNDFGNWTYATKSGTKFHDLNADGVKDTGELGLENWVIYVDYNGNGSKETTEPGATTAADGSYTIQGINPGTWRVREVGQTDWFCSYPTTTDAYGCYHEETFVSDADEVGNDFGNWTWATKSGMKFEDLDGDGVKDGGEPGLENWTIAVLDGTTVVHSTTTAADGSYTFGQVQPGTQYMVCEVLPASDPPWAQTFPTAGTGIGACPAGYAPLGYIINLNSDEDDTGNDFGNFKAATKSGTKFHDLNADGVWQTGTEPGLAGWTIYVDYDDDGVNDAEEPDATTAADGSYQITGILAGTYKVREVGQTDWFCSLPTDDDGKGCYYSETFGSSSAETNNNFGNYTYASKSGMKFHDLNANGVKETGELGLENWVIYVDYDDDGSLDAGEPNATTAADGTYTIQGINPGTWKVREVGQTDWFCSFPTDDDGKGCYHSDTFGSGGAITDNDFGNWTYATKSGLKYHDLNANGDQDAGEPGLENWVIYVDVDADGYDAQDPQATTAADGTYSITGITPGTYDVHEVLQTDWICSEPATSDTEGCGYLAEVFTSGQTNRANDFGNYQPAEFDGYKYEDVNRNGQYDAATDAWLENWTIQLWLDGSMIRTTTTDASGYFAFGDLTPGLSYQVREVCPTTAPGSEWIQTQPVPSDGCGSGTYDNQVPTSGQTITVYFGNYLLLTLNAAITKFHDLNANGVSDAGEPGLAGFVIYIDYNDNGVHDAATEPSAVTDASGGASFTNVEVLEGTYKLREVAGTWTCSYPNAGAGDADPLTGAVTSSQCWHEVVLPGNIDALEFGNWKPAAKSGFKYFDVGNDGDADGLPDAGDGTLAGFVIQLYYDGGGTAGAWDAGDTKLAEATTAGDGSYSFGGLDPGSYLVCEETMGSYIMSYPQNSNCVGITEAEPSGHAFDLLSMEIEENNNFFNTSEIYGCTPGYWKNHQDRWTDYTPLNTLGEVFDPGAIYTLPYETATLIEALQFPGGSGVEGAARILYRAAVSSLLNFAAVNDPYQPFVFVVPAYGGLGEITTIDGLKAAVVDALLSNDRATILALATQLDEANNAVNMCPLSGTRAFKPL